MSDTPRELVSVGVLLLVSSLCSVYEHMNVSKVGFSDFGRRFEGWDSASLVLPRLRIMLDNDSLYGPFSECFRLKIKTKLIVDFI